MVTIVATSFLSGCGGDSQKQERLHREVEDIVSEAYEVRDYQRIIELVDSLKLLGSMSEAIKADTDLFRDGAEQNDDLTMLAFRFTTS